MFAAMRLLLASADMITPYAAAVRYQIKPNTMYRSALYKMFRSKDPAKLAQLRKILDVERPEPVEKKSKQQKFLDRIEQDE